MLLVADSGPILSFARAGLLDLLKRAVGELIVPNAVWADTVIRGKGRPAAEAISKATWIKKRTIKDRSLVNRLPGKLHLGEREAIVLAKELKAILLVDEREARREAERLGVQYFGSLRILKEAKDRGLVKQVRPVLDRLISAGMYLSEVLYHDVLRELGEEK